VTSLGRLRNTSCVWQEFIFVPDVRHINSCCQLTASKRPGVDVMITNFCDFYQFSAKKLPFFSKVSVMIKFLQKWQHFEQKRQNFRHFLRRKYLKNHNIGPSFKRHCHKDRSASKIQLYDWTSLLVMARHVQRRLALQYLGMSLLCFMIKIFVCWCMQWVVTLS
jgi:hypothetical protein